MNRVIKEIDLPFSSGIDLIIRSDQANIKQIIFL